MSKVDARAWFASERAVQDAIIEARARPGRAWLLRESCPTTRQHYFLLRAGDACWVGRRCVGSVTGMQPNAIGACHLLGDQFRFGVGDREMHLDVTLRTSRDAAAFLTAAVSDPHAELVFPFPALDTDGREWVCPPHYWEAASRHAAMLAADERHVRALCARTLSEGLPAGATVHDPACSTGDFVVAMARACPTLHFSGSDVSPAMVDTASRRHERAGLAFTCRDATSLPVSSVDALLLRFLNAEVVTRVHALLIFRRVVQALRPGGMAILFGHSGVLVPVQAEAARLGWQVLSCTAPTGDTRGVFQWYVLRAP